MEVCDVSLCLFRLQHVVKDSMVRTAVPVQVDTRPRAPDTVRSDSTRHTLIEPNTFW